MEHVWGESFEAFNEFENLYSQVKSLGKCCTPEEVSVLKTVIISGSKLICSYGNNRPEISDFVSTTTSTLSDLLTDIRMNSDLTVNPQEIIAIRDKTISTLEAAMERLKKS